MDTQDKRASAVNPGMPWRGLLPQPDAEVHTADREHLAFLYRGVSAAADVTLGPNLFTNTNTFGTPVVTTTYALTPTKFTNSQTFGTPVVAVGDELLPTKFNNTNTFGTPVITTAITLTATLFTNTSTFGTPFMIAGAIGTHYSVLGKTSKVSLTV